MSLNGLDEASVVDAYQAALAEAGGWFLLKYITRDTVDLLSRGSGGVAEVRSAISSYEEKSPLYGLVQFRRKKILLKYVPDGTSRLQLVRLTVQFQSVLEKFVPHDTVLSFAASSELTESALTSACMLHPSPMSLTTSASSVRRQRLGEISEDAEEIPHVRGMSKSKVIATPDSTWTEPLPTPQKELTIATVVEPEITRSQSPLLSESKDKVVTSPVEQRTLSLTSASQTSARARSTTPTAIGASTLGKALPLPPEETPPGSREEDNVIDRYHSNETRLPPLSTSYRVEETDDQSPLQAGRASFSNYDIYDAYKPKVKRGPRPHVEPDPRPQTAGGTIRKLSTQRPVANLPTSIRAQHRPPQPESARPSSRQSTKSVPSKFAQYSQPPAVPPLPSENHISSLLQPQIQQQHIYSKAASITSTATAAATPEKLRLMKALQMRKRNQQNAKRESEQPRPSEDSHSSLRSQIEADLEFVRSRPTPRNPGADRTSASRIEEAAKAAEAARVASPVSIANASEVPSTQASSYAEDRDESTSHASISSETSSSVTPKADSRDVQQRKQAENPVPLPRGPIDGSNSRPQQQTTTLQSQQPISAEGSKPLSPPRDKEATSSAVDAAATTTTNQDPVPQNEDPLATRDGLFLSDSHSLTARPHVPPAEEPTEESQEPQSEASAPRRSGEGEDHRKRGVGLVPLKVPAGSDRSELSDDESLLDELQHAKVQQAKPVSVGRSPVTPIFHSMTSSTDRTKEVNRAVSSPLSGMVRSGSTSPSQAKPGSTRNISTALPSWQPSNENASTVQLAKKGPLSSGISRRIKALEVFTTTRDPSSSSPPSLPNAASARMSKASVVSSMKRLSFKPSGNDLNNLTSTPAPELPAPAKDTYTGLTDYEQSSPLYAIEHPTTESYQPQTGKTISVTARIIRTPRAADGDSTSTIHDASSMPLQRSALTIEHQPSEPRDEKSGMVAESSNFSPEGSARSPVNDRSRPSFSSFGSTSQPHLPTSDSMTSRLSVVSGKKKEKGSFPRSSSDNSSISEQSKPSRARRLMNRVSNLSTSSRRNIAGAFSPSSKEHVTSDTINELGESDYDRASIAESVAHVVDIGDVNVQFPDTLLWKRRFLRIDDKGYLIFTPPTMERNTRNISRRFHLSEFKRPTLPDVEREEMAWSVLLELEDGSCIQCACESKYSQKQVLRMLVDAHSAYHQLYST